MALFVTFLFMPVTMAPPSFSFFFGHCFLIEIFARIQIRTVFHCLLNFFICVWEIVHVWHDQDLVRPIFHTVVHIADAIFVFANDHLIGLGVSRSFTHFHGNGVVPLPASTSFETMWKSMSPGWPKTPLCGMVAGATMKSPKGTNCSMRTSLLQSSMSHSSHFGTACPSCIFGGKENVQMHAFLLHWNVHNCWHIVLVSCFQVKMNVLCASLHCCQHVHFSFRAMLWFVADLVGCSMACPKSFGHSIHIQFPLNGAH